jgi:hypothetical protein
MEDINIGELKRNLLKNVRLMFDEDVLSKDEKMIYSLSDIKQWVEFGLDNGYVNVLKIDEIKDWIKMLKEKSIKFK